MHCRPLQRTCFTESGVNLIKCACVLCDPGCTHWRTVINAWETGTVAAADGVRCARVRWEINLLLTFETAPFFCVHPVFYEQYKLCSSLLCSSSSFVSLSVYSIKHRSQRRWNYSLGLTTRNVEGTYIMRVAWGGFLPGAIHWNRNLPLPWFPSPSSLSHFLSPQVSNYGAYNAYVSLPVHDRESHPYKIAGKFIHICKS